MEKKNRDEIELFDLIVRTIRLIKNNVLLFVALAAVGLVVAFFYHSSLSPVFDARMVVESDILKSSGCAKIAERLDNRVIAGDTPGLAHDLKVSNAEAAQVSKIKVEPINARRDSVFVIFAEVSDTMVLPHLQHALLEYYRNLDFIRVRVSQRKRLCQTMIAQIESEIKFLDGKPEKAGTANEACSRIALTRELLSYTNQLALVEGMQLVAGFTVIEKKHELGLYPSLLLGFLAGILAAFFLLNVRWIFAAAKT